MAVGQIFLMKNYEWTTEQRKCYPEEYKVGQHPLDQSRTELHKTYTC